MICAERCAGPKPYKDGFRILKKVKPSPGTNSTYVKNLKNTVALVRNPTRPTDQP